MLSLSPYQKFRRTKLWRLEGYMWNLFTRSSHRGFVTSAACPHLKSQQAQHTCLAKKAIGYPGMCERGARCVAWEHFYSMQCKCSNSASHLRSLSLWERVLVGRRMCCACVHARFVPRPGPQDALVIYSHNVAFGPLLPFPTPFPWASKDPHPAETTRLSLLLQICGPARGWGCSHHAGPGGNAVARGSNNYHHLHHGYPSPFPLVFPSGTAPCGPCGLIDEKFGCLL